MIEFYVILAVVAAVIIAFAYRSSLPDPVVQYLLSSRLEVACRGNSPCINIDCKSDGCTIILTRCCVDSVGLDGAVSLAIEKKGQDLSMEERIVASRNVNDVPIIDAEFLIDFLSPGRYHVHYNSQSKGLFCAFILTVKPGLTTSKELHH